MKRASCIIHANCQGDELRNILEHCPAFSEKFSVRALHNYQLEAPGEEALSKCSLFIYQPLGGKWKDLSSDRLCEKLPPHAIRVPMPNLFFKGYWPFWDHPRMIEYQDWLLEKLLETGTDDITVQRLYMKGKLAEHADLDKIAEDSLCEAERREQNIPIKTAAHIRRHWRERQLFMTASHPAAEMLELVASGILELLDLPKDLTHVTPLFADFWLPIHPQTARHFRLPWIRDGQRYTIFKNKMTCEEFVRVYVACRRNGIKALDSALYAMDSQKLMKSEIS